MKELEDTKASAEQRVAHLQTQLDEAATLGQSQAAELAAAQSSTASLQGELHGLHSKLAQSESDMAASKEAQTAEDASATEKQQQLAAQASSGLALVLAPIVGTLVTACTEVHGLCYSPSLHGYLVNLIIVGIAASSKAFRMELHCICQ